MLIKTNKKSLSGYEVIRDFVAGVVLEGWEVKSIKAGNVKLTGAFAVLRDDELWLRSMIVGNYSAAEPKTELQKQRERKLLLTRSEITKLSSLLQKSRRLTVVPVELFLQNNLIKIKIAVARAIKKYERKQVIKERDLNKSIAQELKNAKQW